MAKLKITVTSIIFLTLAFLLSAYFTGRKSRSYEVIPFDTKIELRETRLSTLEFADKYRPKIFSNPNNPTQPILWTWYEIIETKNTYDIVYYNCWENEINPKKSYDFIYRIFRSVYFGYPLYDIEYLMVKVEKSSFDIKNLTFETSIDNNYNQKIVTHYVTSLNRKNEHTFTAVIKSKKDKVIRQDIVSIDQTDHKIHLGIQTWNHMLCPISDKNRNIYTSHQNSQKLKELNNIDYKKYKFSRKSQSQYKTENGKGSLVILTAVLFLLFAYPFYRKSKK